MEKAGRRDITCFEIRSTFKRKRHYYMITKASVTSIRSKNRDMCKLSGFSQLATCQTVNYRQNFPSLLFLSSVLAAWCFSLLTRWAVRCEGVQCSVPPDPRPLATTRALMFCHGQQSQSAEHSSCFTTHYFCCFPPFASGSRKRETNSCKGP